MQQSYITEQVSAGYKYFLSPYKDYIDRYTSLYKKKKLQINIINIGNVCFC